MQRFTRKACRRREILLYFWHVVPLIITCQSTSSIPFAIVTIEPSPSGFDTSQTECFERMFTPSAGGTECGRKFGFSRSAVEQGDEMSSGIFQTGMAAAAVRSGAEPVARLLGCVVCALKAGRQAGR